MRSRQITDRDPYKKAHKSYDELHDLLGNLAGKLTEVSKDVDKEFLASYRVHMLSIQTEIKTLREDVDKGVQALKSDGNVAKLELEVNWFVEECTRLRLHYTTMENDCMQMQARYKAMMEQKVYMNEQLKAILKRNRVLEAEIDHALKYNQKIKLTEDHNDALLWDEQNARHDAINFQSNSQQQVQQKDLLPDNYYHEQLRRQSGQQPLSTSVFVPPANGKSSRGRSSRGSSRAGSRPSSRNSSRGSSRSVSPTRSSTPGSPARTSYKEKSFLPSTMSMKGETDGVQGPNGATLNRGMVSIRSHHSAENEDNDDVDIGFEDAVQRQQSNSNLNYDQNPSYNHNRKNNNNNNNQFNNNHVSMRAHHGSVKSLASAASDPNLLPITRGTTLNNLLTDYSGNRRGPVPKQQPVPVAVAKAKKKALAQKLRQNRDDLVDFLKHKSPAEASMEKAIADIFAEVRARKVVAAKRGAIKRYPVNFMGKDDTLNDTDIGTQSNTMLRQRAGATQSRSQVAAQNTSTGSAGEIEGMAGTALGRRLSASASQMELNNNIPDSHRPQAEASQQQQGEEEKEEELLRQSLIQATGGISGLGTKQLSDNDKFSVVVKYLLDFDRFRELVAKLQENQQ